MSLFDHWATLIHRAIPELISKKNTLWTEIRNVTEIHKHMPEVKQYLYEDSYSYIRLVYKCRRRLTRIKSKLWLNT